MFKKIIKKHVRTFIRYILKIREGETISAGLMRKKSHVLKKFIHKTVTLGELREQLLCAGIKCGDTLIVHCAWRDCYMLQATPEEVVRLLLDMVGSEGTILMPGFGEDIYKLDINNSKSAAGVLSECFRNESAVFRSRFPYFCMLAKGRCAEELIEGHENARISFDHTSPYYKAIDEKNAKILLLGINLLQGVKTPTYHFAAVDAGAKQPYYKELYSDEGCAVFVDETGNKKEMKFLKLKNDYLSCKRIDRKLFHKANSYQSKYKGLYISMVNGKKLYSVVRKYCEDGGKIYKKVTRVID